MYRMKPSTFYSLLDYIKDFPEVLPACVGRRDPISIEKQLLITLWYVDGNDSITRIADRFGVSESTVVACRDKVMVLILKLRNRIIRWPYQKELQDEDREFARRNGFPGIVGAIGGTHIPIKAPKNKPLSCVKRKIFISLHLQCICLHIRLFSHVFVGFPGSEHDSWVLQNSDL